MATVMLQVSTEHDRCHDDNPWKFRNDVIGRNSDWSVHSVSYFFIRLWPLRWVPTAHCAGRWGLNLLIAVRPVELAQLVPMVRKISRFGVTRGYFVGLTFSQIYIYIWNIKCYINSMCIKHDVHNCCIAGIFTRPAVNIAVNKIYIYRVSHHFYGLVSQSSSNCDVFSNWLWRHRQNVIKESDERCWYVRIVIFFVIYGSVCRARNKRMYMLSCRTVSVLTRALFWCLFPSLLRNSENEHQNNPLVSTKTVRLSSTYIILCLIQAWAAHWLENYYR